MKINIGPEVEDNQMNAILPWNVKRKNAKVKQVENIV